MSHKIFVNLPVRDLERAVGFFSALGFTFDEQFTDETATCMVISDDIFAMLIIESRFREFSGRAIADTAATAEVLVALSVDTREDVDRMVDAAVAAGGIEPLDPQDHGVMYMRVFRDPDGHGWEIVHMDMDAMPGK